MALFTGKVCLPLVKTIMLTNCEIIQENYVIQWKKNTPKQVYKSTLKGGITKLILKGEIICWMNCNGVSHHFQQYYSYIMAVSFIGWGNQSTQRKPVTSHWQILSHKVGINCVWSNCIVTNKLHSTFCFLRFHLIFFFKLQTTF